MKPKLTEKGTYKTISRVGNILLIFLVFFNACANAYAQEVAAVAADDALEAPTAVAADNAMEAPAADDELTMTAEKEAKAAKAASSDITMLFYSLPKQHTTEVLTDASD